MTRALIAILAAVGILLGVYFAGSHNGAAGEKAAQARAMEKVKAQVATVETKGAGIATAARAALETKTAAIQTRTITLTKEIPVYVTVADDSRCTVNSGAVSLLNAAATDAEVPAAPSGHEQDPAGVALSAVVDAGVYNLGVGKQWEAEAMAWRGWYTAQAALWASGQPH